MQPLQQWLIKAQQEFLAKNDPAVHQQLLPYLAVWVQRWVTTGEVLHKNWNLLSAPILEEVQGNLSPGTLSSGTDEQGANGYASFKALLQRNKRCLVHPHSHPCQVG